jgi:DNA-binding SARP family transcriptional activator/predicted negative regulator of RcsB-dependent stress response
VSGLEFRILGPLEVLRDGVPLALRAPRQQALLAVLVLEANRVVPVSRLIDAIWDDVPPETAKSQVQICVSTVRKLIGADGQHAAVRTRPPGYQLDIPEAAVDAARFGALSQDGRAAAEDGRLGDAIRSLREALALWRGPAAAGIESRVVQIAATRLNEQRLTAVETCIGLELRLGRHAEVAGELAALVAEYPLREKLRAHQMLALYRAGRRADAVAAYREARQVFIDELGLEPGEELRQLEQAMLRGAASLDAGPGTGLGLSLAAPGGQPRAVIPRQLPADIADFAGRRDVVASMCQVLAPDGAPEEPARTMPVALLTGMSGVGKTALAVHVAHLLAGQFPDGQLFIQLRAGDAQPVGSDQALERCVRAIGVAPSALPTGSAELAALYRTMLAPRRVLVVLDDAASLSQVLPLLPGSPNCAVIVTSRRRLPGLVGAHAFEIGVFSPGTAGALLAEVLDGAEAPADQADLAALAELCGYLPLALRIIAAKLHEHPHWSARQLVRRLQDEKNLLAELQIGDTGVAASISLSYESLLPEARVLFLRLGLLGTSDFASWVCAPLLDTDTRQADSLLDQLVAGRLVEVRRAADGSARFHLHELVRAFALGHLAASQPVQERSGALGRLLSCWLSLATEAHRRLYGGDFAVLHGTAPHWPLPETVTADLLRDPLDWFRAEHPALVSAIGKAAQAGLDELCWDLATMAVGLFETDSQFGDWRLTHEVALEAVRRAGNERGEAAVLCSLGELAYVEQRVADAQKDLNRAWRVFDTIGDVHGRALAARHLGFIDRIQGRGSQALARYQSAVRDLQQVGDQIAEAHALSGMAQVLLEREDYDGAEQILRRALDLCGQFSMRRVEAQVTHRLAELFLERGDLDQAAQAFRAVLEAARASGDRTGEVYGLYGVGATLTRMARPDAASVSLSAALELARELGNHMVEGRILLALGELYGTQGQDSAALTALAAASDALRRAGAIVWHARVLLLTGELHRAAGRAGAARAAWTEALDLARDSDGGLAEKVARALGGLGDGTGDGTGERRGTAARR